MKSEVLLSLWVLIAVGCGNTETGRAGEARVPADVAVAWNGLILSVAEAEDRFLTLKGVRTAAMMHLAMHDALAAVAPRYRSFELSGVRSEADPGAAANEAAYAVAVSQYPDQDSVFMAERARWRGVGRSSG